MKPPAARVRAHEHSGTRAPRCARSEDLLRRGSRGRYDAAIGEIQRGVAAGQPMFNTAWLSCDPTFDPLRRDTRFAAIEQSLGARGCAAASTWPIPVRKR